MTGYTPPERRRIERTERGPGALPEPGQDAAAWERTTCRACGATGLHEVLSLGDQPPANAFLSPGEIGKPEPRYPLSLRLCEVCGMVQLGHVVPPELLFRWYLFFTSSSQRMGEHFAALMREAAREFVPAGSLIVELGSNDGTALASLAGSGVRVLGIDPARNISVAAAARGVPTIAEFFSEALAADVLRAAGPAHLIVACNVLGHIDDLDDVCRGVRTLLAPSGAFVFEVPYLAQLVAGSEYDTVYHEHLSYFAVRPLAVLLGRHGLRIERVEPFAVHGGSIRVTARPGAGCAPEIDIWLRREDESGLARRSGFAAMAEQTLRNRSELPARLAELRSRGLKVIGYGAPAKGTVRMNYCGIGTDLVPVVLDSTPAKQGLHVPGTHQIIRPPEALAALAPDVLLLFAWNHSGEIMRRESGFARRGGIFLTPWLEEPSPSE